MSEYFLLEMLDEDWAGVALGRDDPELDDILAAPGPVESWDPPPLNVWSGEMTDYLPSNIGLRLCSARLKDAIDAAANNPEHLQWLPAPVAASETGATHPYSVLHLTEILDVLDAESVMARQDFVVTPVLDSSKLKGESVFIFSGGDQRVVVSADVRRSILGAECTGVGFTEVRVR